MATKLLKKKPTAAFAKAGEASAAHIQHGDINVVAIGALRVLLLKDGAGWFAQGLEIDYAACGKTIEEAKSHFADGLELTILEHLKMNGSIDSLLKVAPQTAWHEFFQTTAECIRQSYSTVQAVKVKLPAKISKARETGLPFPFETIQFIKAKSDDLVEA